MTTLGLEPRALHISAPPQRTESRSVAAQLPHLDLLSLAGRSADFETWQVRDHRSGAILCLKQLNPEGGAVSTAAARLAREAEVCQKTTHENLIRLQDAQLDHWPAYLVFEWLDGTDLETLIKHRGRLDCGIAVWIARQCAQGLHALLCAGHTHGNLKPSTILVLKNGLVKLTGLTESTPDEIADQDFAETPAETIIDLASLTRLEGTTADVFNLGIVLFRMLTGVHPDSVSSANVSKEEDLTSKAAKLRRLAPEVPREITEFVNELLTQPFVRRGLGLSWLIHRLIGLELLVLPEAA